MNLFDATNLGIVEGATESLPISSTGHLIVAASLLGAHDERGKVFEIAIQIGAILAVVWVYRERFVATARTFLQPGRGQRFLLNLLIAFLPVAVLGLLFNKAIKAVLFNAWGVAAASIVGALVICASGLNLYRGRSGVENAVSISSAATWLRVPGLWSRRWPVAQALTVASLRRNGSILRMPQHSPWPSL